jgi:5,10-methylenetetrahydromethanopterin reductase
MRFRLRVPAVRPVRDIVATVRRAEQAGFDAVGFPDSHLHYRELWATLGAVAISTDQIAIGPMVTNLVTRHLTVTASAARAVAEMAPGRLFLGLGAGDSALGFDSLKHTGARATADGIVALRRLLAGDDVTYGSFAAHLRGAGGLDVPVQLAGSGPLMLATAGAVADAVIVTMGALEHKLARIAAGAAEAGRAQPPPVWVSTTTVLTDDLPATSRLLKPYCIRVAQLEGARVFEEAGVPITVPDHLLGAEGDVGHSADMEAAARSLDALVSDEAALWYAKTRLVGGSEADIRARFDELARLGVTGISMSHLSGSDLPDALIDSVGPIIEAWRRAQG